MKESCGELCTLFDCQRNLWRAVYLILLPKKVVESYVPYLIAKESCGELCTLFDCQCHEYWRKNTSIFRSSVLEKIL